MATSGSAPAFADVAVRILHAPPSRDAGPLGRLLADARLLLAEAHRDAFRTLGARDVRIVDDAAGSTPFGRRLAAMAADEGFERLVVLGSGSIPLARKTDLRRFLAAAAGPPGTALANNRYSADVMAIAPGADLPSLPDLPGDNALPRWLSERAGVAVDDLRSAWRLQVDVDGPADLVLLAGWAGRASSGRRVPTSTRAALACAPAAVTLRARLSAVRTVLGDRSAELVITGRVSTASLAWLERDTACRVRALVEERGLRASSRLAVGAEGSRRPARPPRSVLGALLERDGPKALGHILGELGDAAIVDTRVLLAHRLGPDEAAWPPAEDRYASDLLEPASIEDQWLRELTESALQAPIPVLLGGHSLVGPGLRLVGAAGGPG